MLKYDLINPSDPYSFEADDLLVASVMVCLLGEGRYPADALGADANLGNNVPVFMFGGHDEWFTSRFGANFKTTVERCLRERHEALARCFESVTLRSNRRTSLNNIGGKAQAMARAVREQYGATAPTEATDGPIPQPEGGT